MVTLIVALSFIGFYTLYTTSKRADITCVFFIEFWFQANPTAAKAIGLTINFVALLVSISYFGTGSGIFLFLVILMTVGSLVVLITPLKYVNYKTLASLFFLAFLIEVI